MLGYDLSYIYRAILPRSLFLSFSLDLVSVMLYFRLRIILMQIIFSRLL